MPNTSSFGYTNTTANTTTLAPVKLGLVTNYAKIQDTPDACVMANKTSPLDQGELVTIRYQKLDKVSTSQDLAYPLPERGGCQYVYKVEDILRTTDENGKIINDEPVVAYLTIRHQRTGNITADIIKQIACRVLGVCISDKGTTRFIDTMRGDCSPDAD